MDYKKDYYKILGVEEKATPEALRAAYRQLAKLHHPDKNPGDPGAEERFKSINEAYEILSNEITRHIYDSYRTAHQKSEQPQSADNRSTSTPPSYEPRRTQKKRTYTAKGEKRVYVHGTIEAKFQGEPELSDAYTRQWEQGFMITPTEVLVTIHSSNIYQDGPPKEYQLGYSTAALFTTPLTQPVNCRILAAGKEEYYLLDLYDIRIKDPILKDITKHGEYSFGTLQGTLFGYVLDQYEEEVTEEYTEYSGATGHIETKAESGYTYIREQHYAQDGSTYWTEWERSAAYTGRQYTGRGKQGPILRKETYPASGWLWLLLLFILVIIWPLLLYIILPLAGMILLLSLLGWFIAAFNRILPVLSMIIIGIIVLSAIRSLSHTSRNVVKTAASRRFDSVSSKKTVLPRKNKQTDTLITHHLQWEDRDSSRYTILLSLPLSALHQSTMAHEHMDEQEYAAQGIDAVYRFMLNTDKEHLNPIATAFDSTAKAKSLNKQQKASMIVSCIQSIPYSLVVDRSCSANYTDDYISQYLSRCEGDCCKGYSKFGVQSPVEFLGDLKGDCDTRALLLYDILGKLGYEVALMTSNYYRHALIAVCLDMPPSDKSIAAHINGKPYYLWETTSKGFGPGELPSSLSNTNYWNIALIQ